MWIIYPKFLSSTTHPSLSYYLLWNRPAAVNAFSSPRAKFVTVLSAAVTQLFIPWACWSWTVHAYLCRCGKFIGPIITCCCALLSCVTRKCLSTEYLSDYTRFCTTTNNNNDDKDNTLISTDSCINIHTFCRSIYPCGNLLLLWMLLHRPLTSTMQWKQYPWQTNISINCFFLKKWDFHVFTIKRIKVIVNSVSK